MASRIFIVVGALTALVLLSFGTIWYLAYGVDTDAPESVRVSGIEQEATIFWAETGDVTIRAGSVDDFLPGLGFTHGFNHSWSILLLRQAALGRMSEWFGSDAMPEDRLVRQLRLAADAREAYTLLDEQEQRRLKLFSDGITAAIRTRQVRMKAPLVLMEIEPESWQPWHSLAVERLWAWLSAPVQSLGVETEGLAELVRIDRDLRRRLHLFGFENDLAIALDNDRYRANLFRFVTGDSGIPVLQSFAYRRGDREVMRGLSVPGTLILPAGRTADFSWTFLLDSEISHAFANSLESEREVSYDRIRDGDGEEEIIEIGRWGNSMPVNTDRRAIPGRPVELIDWTGLRVASDSRNWLTLLDGQYPSLTLFRPDGLLMRRGEAPTVSGSPTTSRTFGSRMVFVSNAPSAPAVLDRLAALDSTSSVLAPWTLLRDTETDSFSLSVERMISSLGSQTSLTSNEADALTYLRNWDSKFSPASIAASIVNASEMHDGAAPETDNPERRLDGLRRGLEELVSRYGTDMSMWRWETVQDRTTYFPGWRSDNETDIRRIGQFNLAFGPVHLPGRGHPSTLSWGPAYRTGTDMASSAWEGYWGSQPGSSFEFQHPDISYSSFLGRFLAENRAIRTVRAQGFDQSGHATTMLPE